MSDVKCMRCQSEMEAGFVADITQAGYLQQKWYRGRPEPSFWTGLKVDKEHAAAVTTLRCPQCGYLESYAGRVLEG